MRGRLRRGREPMSLLDRARQLQRQGRDRLRERERLVREYHQLRKVAERLGLRDAAREPAAGSEAQPAEAMRRGNAKAHAPKRPGARVRVTGGKVIRPEEATECAGQTTRARWRA